MAKQRRTQSHTTAPRPASKSCLMVMLEPAVVTVVSGLLATVNVIPSLVSVSEAGAPKHASRQGDHETSGLVTRGEEPWSSCVLPCREASEPAPAPTPAPDTLGCASAHSRRLLPVLHSTDAIVSVCALRLRGDSPVRRALSESNYIKVSMDKLQNVNASSEL